MCSLIQFSSVAQTCLTLCDPMNHSMPGLPITNSRSLPKPMSIESLMPSSHLILMAGVAVKRYPTSQIRETQVRWFTLREGIRGQTDRNHNHRQLANLITWTTGLSNSVKQPCHMGPLKMDVMVERGLNVVHWRRE